MDIPQISDCGANTCAYNDEGTCHAAAITVGDTVTPHCDTYVEASEPGGFPTMTGRVGACKVASCRNNQNLTCTASSVRVGKVENEVRCLSFIQ